MNQSQILLKKVLSILTLILLVSTFVIPRQEVVAAPEDTTPKSVDSAGNQETRQATSHGLNPELMDPQQTSQCVGSQSETANNPLTGKINFVGTNVNEPIRQFNKNPHATSPELAAREYLSNCGSLFGLSDQATEITVKRQTQTEDRRSVFHLQQLYQGIPVFAGELVMQLNAVNDVILVNGNILPDINLNIEPNINATDAQQEALLTVAKIHHVNINDLQASTARLWIYSPVLIGYKVDVTSLVWLTEITPVNLVPIRELVLIDANLGTVVFNINQVDTAKNRLTYTADNTLTQPGTLVCDESDPACAVGDTDAVNAHIYAGDTYDFYSAYYDRDSIDNAGMPLIATVHYDTGYCNAFWNGYQMTYGDGCSIVADDVVAHEMTHGVTQYESGLFYYNQSGAINESFSDIWGEFVDLTNGKGNDSPGVRWLIGEDTSIGAIRNMKDPTTFGDPDRMTAYLLGGDVHINSGIGNKTAYLITDGDTFNGYTVTGLGITKAAKIYYEAQTNILTTSSDYYDLYNALHQACNNLIGTSGITADDCIEVREATEATELNYYPSPPPAPNDEISNAITIDDTPYTSSFDTTSATLAVNDPILPCTNGKKGGHTVWYSFIASATGKLKADTHGSEYLNVLAVWSGTPGNLTPVGCGYDNNTSTSTSKVYVNILAGETYYLEVAGITNSYYGNMALNVDFIIPTYITCADVTQIPLAECNALKSFYDTTDGPHWTYTDWFETTTPCSWYGMYCKLGSNVTNMYLVGNNLTGPIPPELGSLTQLETLWANSNQLSGNIPPELGNLKRLQVLSLGTNRLTGNIPPELDGLIQLYYLGLDVNQLTDSIPPELGNLSKLQNLYLGANQLTGSIPPELGNLTKLWILDVRNNQLSGSIPPQLGHLSQLFHLWLKYNHLSGSIPSELGSLSQLGYFLVNDNQLIGGLPDISGMTALKTLDVQNNKLGGEIPISITELSLTSLHLSCGLTSSDPAVITYLNTKVPGWRSARCVTTITADAPDPSLPGQPVNVTVTVGGGTTIPTGTVIISGADTNCQITLSGGTGNCNITFNTIGAKTLTAIYNGNSTFSGSWNTETHGVVGQTPTDIVLSNNSVDENRAIGTTVGTLGTIDPDVGDIFIYTFCGGTDDSSFSTTGDTLKTAVIFDYEARSSYSICVRTIDNGGLAFDKTFTVSVTDVNERATNLSLSNTTAPEGLPAGLTVGTFSTTDPDSGDTFTYAFCGGTGDTFFWIDTDTLKTSASFDYEARSSYSICVRTIDNSGLAFDKTFTISVTDVNERVTNLSLSNTTVPEGLPAGSTVGTFIVTDPDSNDYHIFAFCAGIDDSFFSIYNDTLYTTATLDYEEKASYSLCIRAVDSGGLTFEKTLTISVTDVNEPPFNLFLSSYTVAEGLPSGSTVGSFTTTDPDLGDTFTYSLIPGSGNDNAAFTISGNELKTLNPFNYLTKNSYLIDIQIADSKGLTFEKTFTIAVTDTAPIFTDVPDSYWATAWIERLFNAGVTGGCSAIPLNYCPDATVTRAQMAIFLLRGEHGSAYTPPAVGADTVFSDVPTNHWAAAWIEQLAAEGITGGCAPGKYCPESPVTRDQMAIFLLRTKYGSYSPPPATGVFSDVPATHWAAVWIEQLAAEGITSGCGTGIYCPDDIVTRAQMAVFLVRTFGLP